MRIHTLGDDRPSEHSILPECDAGRAVHTELDAATQAKRPGHDLGSPADLTEMEFDLLEMLMRSAGRVVSREELTLALFERAAAPYDRILDVHVSRLRKTLVSGRSLIRTIRGVGYVFARAA